MSKQIIQPADKTPILVLGMPHTPIVSLEQTNGAYELVHIAGQPGQFVPPHVHQNDDETFHVLSGSVIFTINGEDTAVEAGTTVFLPRGLPHGFKISGSGPAEMMLTVSPKSLMPMFKALSALPAGPPNPAKVAEICGQYDISFV